MLLDCQLAKKDSLQINAFLASGGRVERNLKALQMKATTSLGGGAIGGNLSFINVSLSGSNYAEQWQEEWPTGRSKIWLSEGQHQLHPFDPSLTMPWSSKESDPSNEVHPS